MIGCSISRSSNRTLLFINLIFALAAATVLAAQDTSASVSGEIDGPTADAELTLQTAPHTVFSVRTHDGGKFKFSVLPAGTYTLTMSFLGFRTLRVKSIQVASGEHKVLPRLRVDMAPSDFAGPPIADHMELATDQRVGNLSGRVENDRERPISHAMVKLLCDEKICSQTKTDAKGEFIFFNLLPRENYVIRVTHPGYYPWQGTDYQVQAGYDANYGSIVVRPRAKLSRAASTVR
jgi:hypothetical protein